MQSLPPPQNDRVMVSSVPALVSLHVLNCSVRPRASASAANGIHRCVLSVFALPKAQTGPKAIIIDYSIVQYHRNSLREMGHLDIPGALQVEKGEHTAFPVMCMRAMPGEHKKVRKRDEKRATVFATCCMLSLVYLV